VRTLEELTGTSVSAIHAIRRWVDDADCDCTILPPSEDRARTLLSLQIPTDHPLGAIAYETGGILIDHGWLRFLGCGHPTLARNVADWSVQWGQGLWLVADDVVGGFFAVNGGAFGEDTGMHYWAPDSLQWEPIGFEFDFFFRWSLTPALGEFYQHLRWRNWVADIAGSLSPDCCFMFDPPLWSDEGTVKSSRRDTLPATELYATKLAAQQNN